MATGERHGPVARRLAMLTRLADPRLTGLTRPNLDRLCAQVAIAQAARTAERYAEQRGGRARKATGKLRVTPLFDDASRVVITLVYQRQVCSMTVLADLLEVTGTCISDTIKETRDILADHGQPAGAAPVRFHRTGDLLAFLDTDQPPRRAEIIHALSDPVLTGISRTGLDELTEQIAPRQAAQAERESYTRRGAPRQAGTRGGVFPQKISNKERVLLTLLYARKLCTMDVLADALGDVCRSSIGQAIRQTRPLLQREGALPTPAGTRYRTAAELIAAGNTPT